MKNAMIDDDDEVNANNDAATISPQPAQQQQQQQLGCCRRLCKIYSQYEFLILIVVGICIARAYPPLGAEYLQPEITATWVAVIFIFCKLALALDSIVCIEFLVDFLSLSLSSTVYCYSFVRNCLEDRRIQDSLSRSVCQLICPGL
jgi:hypothetical protein